MRLVVLIFGAVLLVGCARLDSFMFNADTSIVEYKLDDYDGETEVFVDADYDIADQFVHLFTINGQNGVKLWAIYLGDTARIATDTVILYCHGNKDHMDLYWPRAKLLANVGGKNRYGVLMFDYRGFGLSEGEPTENGLTEDANLAAQWLKNKGLTGDRLIMYGFSLGTAPATDLTAEPQALNPSKLILENPFASTEVMVQDATALDMPDSFVTNAKYDNAEQIKQVQQPFLWIHGVDDTFLNMETHGEVVYKNYSGSYGVPVRVEGGTHSNVPYAMGYEEYLVLLEAFILH